MSTTSTIFTYFIRFFEHEQATVERATMSDSMANAALNILVDAYDIHTDSEKIIVHFRKKYEEKYEEFRWSMIQTCGGYGIAARRYVTLKVNLSNGSVVEYIVFTNDKVQGA